MTIATGGTARTYCGVGDEIAELASTAGDGVGEVISAAGDAVAPDICHVRIAPNLLCLRLCYCSGPPCPWESGCCFSLSFSAFLASICARSGIRALSSGGSCCILLSLSAFIWAESGTWP